MTYSVVKGNTTPDPFFSSVRLRHQSMQTLHFSAHGAQLLSQGYAELRLWDVASGALKQQLPAPKESRRLIASPDDRFLAGVAGDKVVLVDKAFGDELARWEHARGWDSLAFSKDGQELVGLTAEQTFVRWSTEQRKEIARVPLDVANVDVKRFSGSWHLAPDASVAAFLPPVATDEKSTTWHFWDTATGKQALCSVQTAAPFTTFGSRSATMVLERRRCRAQWTSAHERRYTHPVRHRKGRSPRR